VDVGYSHLFLKNTAINQNAGNTTGYGLLNGSYKESINILGAQLAYRF
jgi:long-subunit fatty acid transport protein